MLDPVKRLQAEKIWSQLNQDDEVFGYLLDKISYRLEREAAQETVLAYYRHLQEAKERDS